MSDYDDDETPEDKVVTLKRSEIRALEKKAAKADEAETRASAAERKLAFAEAGINLTDPKLSYFVKGYDGDLTADAIKQAATDAGFLSADAKPDDAAALARLQEATTGAPPVPASYEEEMANASTNAEVVAIAAKYGRLAQPQ